MPENKDTENKVTYLNVMSDGKFHQKVEEGTPGAVLREGETKDGTKYSKLELITDFVAGKITKVDFYDGEYGKSLVLNLETLDGDVSVSLSTASDFGKDMLHKILSVDLGTIVTLTPFIEETNKLNKKGEKIMNKGIRVVQNGNQVWSHFQKWDKDLGKFVSLNGMPEAPTAPAGKKPSSDEWKMYFMQAKIFMIKEVEKAFKIVARDNF